MIQGLTSLSTEENLPKAYLREEHYAHVICAWCPDKTRTEDDIRLLEELRQHIALVRGKTEHQIKKISHGLCPECREDFFPIKDLNAPECNHIAK